MTWVIAHRGSSWDEQENTLPAFERAIAVGADYVELDVQMSGDGEPVVFHDTDLDRLTPLTGPLRRRRSAELREVGIPTLDEVLELTRGRIGVMAELKSAHLYRAFGFVERTVSRLARTDVVVSFQRHALLEACRLRPELRLVQAALTVPQDLVRVTFAVPWYGMLLLGTTEAGYDGDPRGVAASVEDVDQILAEAAVALDPELVRPERVRAAFAGLRVLPAGEGESVSARRETVYTVGRSGMLSVAGGKLTTYRRIALGALERLSGDLGLRDVDTRPWPLPGASGLDGVRLPAMLDADVRAHLLHLYGSLAEEVLAPAAQDPALLDRLDPGGPDIAAQALYASTREWARGSDDVIRRRTTLFYRGLASDDVVRRVDGLIARTPSA